MHREHHRWYSPSLGRDMELLIVGHAGARLLVFPTSMGRFYEWEDRGMFNTLGDMIDSGNLQAYCVDSVDAESWYARWKHPGARAWRNIEYDRYLANEVLPLSRQKNKGIGNALRLWDGWAHDWPWWHQMIRLYMGGHD